MILAGTHQPRRPQWVCRCCGDPYPCQAERDRLVAAYGLSRELGELASEMLHEAVRDLPDASVADLYDRFVRWTEPVPRYPELPLGRYL